MSCPNCGYCPHCGRSGHQTQPFYQPYQTYPWNTPVYYNGTLTTTENNGEWKNALEAQKK